MSTIINLPLPLHQYSLLWVATPSATFPCKFLDHHLHFVLYLQRQKRLLEGLEYWTAQVRSKLLEALKEEREHQLLQLES